MFMEGRKEIREERREDEGERGRTRKSIYISARLYVDFPNWEITMKSLKATFSIFYMA